MPTHTRFLRGTVPFLLVFTFSACSGGGSGTTPPPAAPDFSISLEASNVTLQQQGSFQFQTVQINPLNSFRGTVAVTLSGLPGGVTATPPGPYSLSLQGSNQGVSLQLSASLSAATGNSTVKVTATSGSITFQQRFHFRSRKPLRSQSKSPPHLFRSPLPLPRPCRSPSARIYPLLHS